MKIKDIVKDKPPKSKNRAMSNKTKHNHLYWHYRNKIRNKNIQYRINYLRKGDLVGFIGYIIDSLIGDEMKKMVDDIAEVKNDIAEINEKLDKLIRSVDSND